MAPPGTPYRPLYDDRIRWSGQPVALVVAEEAEIARFAASLVRVQYDEEAHVTDLDRLAAADRPVHDRHGNLRARAADDLADAIACDTVERVRELVRVALAADFAVRDDVDAGALLLADRDDRRVVLRLLEPLGWDPPDLARTHARRHHFREHGAVDEPIGLGIASNQ